MKRIVYANSEGGVSVIHPSEGARLALSVTLADQTVLTSPTPQPVDLFVRGWPVAGATAEWAETEDQFLLRVQAKDVPAGVSSILLEPAALPSRADRRFWIISNGSVIVDTVAKAAAVDLDAAAAVDKQDRLLFEVLFDMENRMRTRESRPTVTRSQYRTGLINTWKALP